MITTRGSLAGESRLSGLHRCLVAGVVISLSLVSAGASAGTSGLFDFEGRSRDLSEFTGQGQWTVVMFWASDCHVCNAEAQEYVTFHDQHHDKQAAILGITLDGRARMGKTIWEAPWRANQVFRSTPSTRASAQW